MCPDLQLLEQLALGLLSAEQADPLEEHLADCASCLQTLIERDPADTVIEALRQAPATAERRAAFQAEIDRLEAALAARAWGGLSKPSQIADSAELQTQGYAARHERPGSSHDLDTSPSNSAHSTDTPPTEPDSADESESYDFLAPAQSPDELGRLGGYRVLRVLGTGGMGVVFEAEDPQLKRHVALKAMKPGVAASSSARKRFLREAQTAASVEHDHIVPVYQVGEDRGVPFIAMPLLRGETLAERLERERSGFGVQGSGSVGHALRGVPGLEDGLPSPSRLSGDGLGRPSSGSALPLDEFLRIGREVALGLAAAHRRGLIHRDIKPSNIWLEEETGRAKILDFGLARAGDGGEQLTQAGAMLGTPAYMSPEQASGDDLDARSDLFSLGCVLYQCATGCRPFVGRDPLSTMVAVTTVTPPAPRELNPTLPAELDALIVSLLSKDPGGRLQSARDVAERLASVGDAKEGSGFGVQGSEEMQGEDILLPLPPGEGWGGGRSATTQRTTANPASSKSSSKPPRRRGLVMLAAAATGAALLAGIVVVIKNEKGQTIATVETNGPATVSGLPPGHTATFEQKAEEKAEGKRPKAEAEAPKTQDQSPKTASSNPKSKIENPKSVAPPPLPSMSEMALVTEPTPIPGAKSWTLETIDHRGDIFKMEFNPDSTLLATYGEDGAVRLWNSETGKLVRIFVGADSPSGGIAWSPDGAAIAVAAGTKIRAWEAATGNNVCTIALVDGEAASLAWSRDGRTFAVGQRPLDQPEAPARHLCLYDAATGKLIADRHRDDWSVEQIAWSPDGKRLLIDDPRDVNWLFDIAGNGAQSVAVPIDGGGRHLAWTSDGVPLVAGTNQHAFCVWRAQPLELLQRFVPPAESTFYWHALSSDGQFAVAGFNWHDHATWSERGASVFNCVTGEPSGGFDQFPSNKDLSNWELQPRYSISPDGKRFARSGRHFGGPAVFAAEAGSRSVQRHQTTIAWETHQPKFCARWSHDGASLAWRGENGAIQFWPRNTASGQINAPPPPWGDPSNHSFAATDVRWSAANDSLVAAFWGCNRLDRYASATGEILSTHGIDPGSVLAGWPPALSPDGCDFASGLYNMGGQVGIFDARTGARKKMLSAVTTSYAVAYSPDAKQLGVHNGEATEIWDIDANECVRRFDGGKASLVWSPDGSRFVLSGGGEATIHAAASGNVMHSLDEPPGGAATEWPRLAWSPDSRYLAGRGRIWDAETGEIVARLPSAALAGEIGAPAWSSDGSTIAYLGPGRAVVVADVGNGLRAVPSAGDATSSGDLRNGTESVPYSGVPAALAPKVRHSTAQGETLGPMHAQNAVALKGRDSDGAQRAAGPTNAAESGESRPVGADNSHAVDTQGSAALRPGLSNLTPSGSPRVEALLLTFNRGQVLSIAPSGHYRASPRADELLVYVVETAAGQETLSREQFAERFGWKNDVGWALPTTPIEPRQPLAEAASNGGATVGNAHPTSIGHMALVQNPPGLPGVESWTIAARSVPHSYLQWQPIDLSRDGKWLAHAGQDGAVRLIDTVTGKVERHFSGHDEPLAAVEFSPDGRLVASLDSIVGNVRIWDAATGRQIHSARAGRGFLLDGALHWSPDGALLAVSVEDAPLRLIDVASGEFLPQSIGHDEMYEPDYFAWSPDGRRFVSVGRAHDIRIWDTATLEPVLTLESKFDTFPHVAFAWSPDGKAIAACAQNGEIRVWDPATGKLLKAVKDKQATYSPRIAWLPDNKTIAISGRDGTNGWRLWDAAAGQPVGDFVPYGYLWGFSLAHGGETLAMGDARIGLFDVPSRTLKREIEALPWAHSAAWSTDGRELAVTADNMAVWSNNKHRGLAMLPTARAYAAWSAEPDMILNAHWDNYAQLYRRRGEHWEEQDPKAIDIGDGAGPTVLSPDGKRLACAGKQDAAAQNKEPVDILDLATGKRFVQTEPLGQWVRALAWSPDATLLAAGTDVSGAGDGSLAIYEAPTGRRLAELPAVKALVRPIAFSPDGKSIAVGYGGNGNGFVRLYDLGALVASVVDGAPSGPLDVPPAADGEPSGETPQDADKSGAERAANAPAQRNATEGVPYREGNPDAKPDSAAAPPEPKADGTRSVPATLKLIRELACNQGPQDPAIGAMHWSADGRTLKVLDRAAVYVFDAMTGERLAEAPRLDRTPHRARPANFSPDGRLLAVATTTCTRVWDLAELNEAAEQASGIRRQASGDGSAEEKAEGKRQRAENDEPKTQELSPKTSPSNPKSKIENPKLRLVASVVPLGHGQAVVVGADGHWLGTRGAEKEIVYVIKTAAGQEILTPREFYKRFNWKNDPSKVVLPE